MSAKVRIHLLLVSILLGLGMENTLIGQCETYLIEAEALVFSRGNLSTSLSRNQIPGIILPCLESENFLEKSQKNRAYEVLIQTYLDLSEYQETDKNLRLAREYLQKLLKKNPRFNVTNPKYGEDWLELYNSLYVYPVNRIGASVGFNWTYVNRIYQYSIDNPTSTPFTESRGSFSVTGFYEKLIKKSIPTLFIGTELGLSNSKYYYQKELETTTSTTGQLANFTSLSFTENQSAISLGVYTKYFLIGKEGFLPYRVATSSSSTLYLLTGVNTQYLISAKFQQLTRNTNETLQNTFNLGILSPQNFSITDQRHKLNYGASVGMGAMISSNRSELAFELRYRTTLRTANKRGAERYANSELIYLYGYLDDDFRIAQLTLSLTYSWLQFNHKLK